MTDMQWFTRYSLAAMLIVLFMSIILELHASPASIFSYGTWVGIAAVLYGREKRKS